MAGVSPGVGKNGTVLKDIFKLGRVPAKQWEILISRELRLPVFLL